MLKSVNFFERKCCACALTIALWSSAAAHAHIASTAYRVLRQASLQNNGMNLVPGLELNAPSGIAIDARGAQVQPNSQSSGIFGLTPGDIGLWQINVTVPRGLPAGTTALRVVLNGAPRNPVTIAVR